MIGYGFRHIGYSGRNMAICAAEAARKAFLTREWREDNIPPHHDMQWPAVVCLDRQRKIDQPMIGAVGVLLLSTAERRDQIGFIVAERRFRSNPEKGRERNILD